MPGCTKSSIWQPLRSRGRPRLSFAAASTSRSRGSWPEHVQPRRALLRIRSALSGCDRRYRIWSAFSLEPFTRSARDSCGSARLNQACPRVLPSSTRCRISNFADEPGESSSRAHAPSATPTLWRCSQLVSVPRIWIMRSRRSATTEMWSFRRGRASAQIPSRRGRR